MLKEDRGLQLVRENDFDTLSDLMKDPEWNPMSSLLLLLSWDHCKSMQSAKKLLDTLYRPQDQNLQPALFSAIQKLYYQLNLADWCIDKVRPILSTSSSSSQSSGSFQQEGELFSRLESQSILYMLHQSNSLSSSDPKEIMELLKMSPSIDDLPGTLSVPKTSSQARDIAVYRSFCAIRLTMDAILCSAHLGNLIRDERARCQILEIFSYSKMDRSVSGEVFTTVTDSLQTNIPCESDKIPVTDTTSLILAVDGFINRTLEEVKNYLQSIYPLYYRLEIIENIYSLLFLKYENLAVDGCDSEDTTRSQHYTRSDIREYLILSISRNVGYKQTISIVSNDTDSEQSSSLSASTNSLVKEKRIEPVATGFLLSRPMIEKMLQLLRDAIYDIQTSRYAFRRESIPGELRPAASEQSVYSSINHDILHSRLSQLEKCINEATWRYKLVTTTEAPTCSLEDSTVSYTEDAVCSKWEAELNIGADTQSSSDIDFSNDEDDMETGDRRHSSISLGKPQPHEKGLYTKSEVIFLSDREQKGKTSSLKLKIGDSGDEGDTEDKKIFLKPKPKTGFPVRKHKRKNEKFSRDYSSKQNIIRKMLSSPVNLLNMCLKLGNFVSAYEVVKIFKLEGHIGAQMVHFAEKMESIGCELSAVTKQDEEPTFDPIEIMKGETVSSEDYDKLTVYLSKNSVVKDELNNILISTNLSKIMLSGQESMLLRAKESVILRQLVNFVPSLIILDLLCAYDISYETGRELLKNATQKLSIHQNTGAIAPKLSRTTSSGSLKPLATKAFDKQFIFENYSLSQPLIFLQTINEIIKTSGDLVLPLQLVRNGHMLKALTPNLLLTKFADSLRPSYFVSLKKLREFQYRAVERLFRAVRSTLAVEEQGLVNDMMMDNITSSLNDLFKAFSTNREGILIPSNAVLTIQDTPDSPDTLGIGTVDLSDQARGSIGEELDTLSVEFPQMNSMKYSCSYFDCFFQHLETIRSFLIKHDLQENTTALSSMVLLKESPSKIVARLIFEKQLKPEMLEDLAKSIRLDVVLIMIRFTCPALNSCSTKFNAFPFLARCSPTLNPINRPNCGNIDTVESLLTLSETIITKALVIMNERLQEEDQFLGFEYLSECASHPQYIEFEELLETLHTIDLLLLANDENKIIFYVNIVNALNIHAAICQSVLMKKRNEDLSIFGVTTMLCFFIQTCYYIGQLGIVKPGTD
ncbi:Zinc finger FYVE domain-containing protein 26-like [Oopsacas minuta]|uniref:Zinc finger FYVE domain-containing protein 26-like n=1 Tax=Oopsacas minuta TaxID=111878 RepID=A0AAV7KEQ9_9METZ|nr:Zinc finger FYVE domain-containing protein 26-like [Oopsacas minuta]